MVRSIKKAKYSIPLEDQRDHVTIPTRLGSISMIITKEGYEILKRWKRSK